MAMKVAAVTEWPKEMWRRVMAETEDALIMQGKMGGEAADRAGSMRRCLDSISDDMLNETFCRGFAGEGGPLDPENVEHTVFDRGLVPVTGAASFFIMRALEGIDREEARYRDRELEQVVGKRLMDAALSGAPLGPVPSTEYGKRAEIRCGFMTDPWFVVSYLERCESSLSGYTVCTDLYECDEVGEWRLTDCTASFRALSTEDAVRQSSVEPMGFEVFEYEATGIDPALAEEAIGGDMESLACCIDLFDGKYEIEAPEALAGDVEAFRSSGIEEIAGAAHEVSEAGNRDGGETAREGEER